MPREESYIISFAVEDSNPELFRNELLFQENTCYLGMEKVQGFP